MKMTELRAKARPFGLQTVKMKKAELIRAIQAAEGNNACFGTSDGHCPYTDCCFRDDCLGVKIW